MIDLQQQKRFQSEGLPKLVTCPYTGEEGKVYISPVDGNTAYFAARDREFAPLEEARLEELGAERVKELTEGGREGLMELRKLLTIPKDVAQAATARAMVGTVLKGWEDADFGVASRGEDGELHRGHADELLAVHWIYSQIIDHATAEAEQWRLDEVTVKKSQAPSAGSSATAWRSTGSGSGSKTATKPTRRK